MGVLTATAVETNMPNTIKTMTDPADAVMLLVDHQSGLFQLVKDIDAVRLGDNVSALAKVSRARQAVLAQQLVVVHGPGCGY
jgi:hypothetical protein